MMSINQQKEIAEVLEQFGLKERDRAIYFALLGSGRATITPLARRVNMPITTVQSVLARLTELGIIGVTTQKSRHVYEAYDPIIISEILKQQEQEAINIVPLLRSLRNEMPESTKIKIYNKDRSTDILRHALETKNKLIYEIVSAKDFQGMIGEKFHFTRRRMENRVHLKSLRVERFEIKKYSKVTHVRELREAKFLPREMAFNNSIMFWDNTVAFFSTTQEGLAWTVECESLREMFKQTFDLLWSVSRPMETDPARV